MQQVPKDVLAAALYTLHWALVYCRNITISPSVDSRRQVNEIMEATHEIPDFLANWHLHSLDELRLHLNCFDSSKWVGAPNLTKIFDAKLQEFNNGNAA